MAKVSKKPQTNTSASEKLLTDIQEVCRMNPHSNVAATIGRMIDDRSIPMQMDKDMMRRLTDPVCNPLDVNFDLPLSAMNKQFVNA